MKPFILMFLFVPVMLHAGFRASDICQSYETNRASAETRFEFSRITVSGVVTRVRKEYEFPHYIDLSGYPLGIKTLRCLFMYKDHDLLARISPGNTIQVNGICTGIRNGIIQMRDCNILLVTTKDTSFHYKDKKVEKYMTNVENWLNRYRSIE